MDHWGPYKLPYLPSYCRKLTNSEVLELIKSNRKRAIRIPQACRRNAVFLIDSRNVAQPEDVQSDLMVSLQTVKR